MNDALLLPAVLVVLPLALYELEDEADSDFCNNSRNCFRMSSTELVSDELLPSLADEPSAGGGPPYGP